MSPARRSLCTLYYAIAGIALIATWRQNLAFGRELGLGMGEMFVAFWPALLANRATISITVDIFLFALAAVVWMVLEARRLQLRFAWAYVVFGILIAISVTFPLFLAARERRLAIVEAAAIGNAPALRGGATTGNASEPTPTLGDKLGLGFMTLGTVAFAVWCTIR